MLKQHALGAWRLASRTLSYEVRMNKNVKIFIITFVIVLVLGLPVLAIMSKVAKNKADKTEETKESMVSVAKEVEFDTASSNDISENTVSEDTVSENEIAAPTDEELYGNDPRTTIVKTKEDGVITISFAGDILFDPSYATYSSYLSRGKDISSCITSELLNKMKNADVMMINNEFPYSDRGAPQEDKMYTFRAPTSAVSVLDEMGVDIVTLANNHTFDYGEDAFMDTLVTLENANMPYVGAGRNIDDAAKPYYFVANGKKIAIIAATQIERYANPNTRGATASQSGVFRCLEPERLIEEIKKAKEEADFVILFIHWGTESTDELDWCQEPQAKQYVDAGVDMIVGAHPHVLQEIAYIDGTPVIYSLGNFWFNSKTMDSCIVTLELNLEDTSIKSLRFEPCLQSNMTTSLLKDGDKMRVIEYMRSISSSANIDDDGYVSPKP